MPAKSKKTQLFTTIERQVAGLAILTAIVLTLSAQVVESMVRPSLGLYDAHPVAVASMSNVIDAQPVA